MELLYYKDEDSQEINDDNILKLITISSNQTHTNSQAIYRISPVVSHKHSKENFVYPKIKVHTDEDLRGERKLDQHEDLHVIMDKFDMKQNVFGKQPEVKESSESNFLEVVDPEYNPETHEDLDFEIKKPDEEEDQRKHLDKFNLLRAFQYAIDPYSNKSQLKYEEDYADSEIHFENIDERVKNLFRIGAN